MGVVVGITESVLGRWWAVVATFVGTAECDAAGRMTRYLITSSPDIRLSLPAP
jgi:hypothetical protein